MTMKEEPEERRRKRAAWREKYGDDISRAINCLNDAQHWLKCVENVQAVHLCIQEVIDELEARLKRED
jgi:hypothetical protein